MTGPCPSREVLVSFSNDLLPVDEEVSLLAHLDECALCQKSMDEITTLDIPMMARIALSGTLFQQTPATSLPNAPTGIPARIGPYRIESELGQGAMGIVYLGIHGRLQRKAAIKVLRRGSRASIDEMARFRKESLAIAAVKHPNVVEVYEAGEDEQQAWIALEYIADGTLREFLQARPIAARQAALLVAALAEGVAAAHEHGVIHRDIKPANILMRRDDKTVRTSSSTERPSRNELMAVPKLTDFGMARLKDSTERQTQTGFIVGTPHYMSPEQAKSQRDITQATDIYSLGAVLYECLTGRPPFDAPDLMVLLQQVIHHAPVPPRRLQPGIPIDLETICLKCLQKEPERRYSSAGELATDLESYLAHRPIRARPVNWLEASWQWCRRNPRLAGMAACLVLALFLGTAGVFWQWNEAVEGRNRATSAETIASHQRDEAISARQKAQFQSALAYVDKGISLAEQGDVSEGLGEMLAGLQMTPENEKRLQQLARHNLASWHQQTATLQDMHHFRGINSAPALSVDGQRIAWVMVNNQDIVVYDVQKKQEVYPPFRSRIQPHQLHWTKDRRYLTVLTTDPQVMVEVWDMADQPKSFSPVTLPYQQINSFDIHSESRLLALGFDDGSVQFLDLKTGKLIASYTLKHDGAITCIKFTPQGDLLVFLDRTRTTHSGTRCYRWKVPRGETETARKEELPWAITSTVVGLSYSADNSSMFTIGKDGTCQLWNASSLQPLGSAYVHTGSITAAEFSPDNRLIALLAEDGSICFRDVVTGEILVGTIRASQTVRRAIRFSPDGKLLYSCEDKGDLCSWALPSSYSRTMCRASSSHVQWSPTEREVLESFQPAMTHFYASREWIATVPGYNLVRLSNYSELDKPSKYLRLPYRITSALAFAPDGKNMAIACFERGDSVDALLHFADPRTGKLLGKAIPQRNWIRGMSYHPKHSLLATAGYDRGLYFWDYTTMQRVSAPRLMKGIVVHLEFSLDGNVLAAFHARDNSGRNGVTLYHFAIKDGLPVVEEFGEIKTDNFGTCSFTSDGKFLLVNARISLQLWDMSANVAAGPVINTNGDKFVAYDPVKRIAFTGGVHGIVEQWNLTTGERAGPTMNAGSPVRCIELDCDVERGFLAIGCQDGNTRLWDPVLGRSLGAAFRHGKPLRMVRFRAPGSLMTTAEDGSIRTWVLGPSFEGDHDSLQQLLQVRTGRNYSPEQKNAPLDAAGWLVSLSRISGREEAETRFASLSRHARLADAEADRAWFTANWHLPHANERERSAPEMKLRQAWIAEMLHQDKEAIESYQLAEKEMTNDQLADWHMERAVELEKQDRLKEAETHLSQALKKRGTDWSIMVARALLRQRMGMQTAYEQDYEQLLKSDIDVYFLISRIPELANANQWKQVVATYQALENRNIWPIQFYSNFTIAALKADASDVHQKLSAQMEARLLKAKTISEINDYLWFLCLGPRGPQDPQRWITQLEAEIPKLPTASQHPLLNTLGGVYLRAKQYQKAIDTIQRGIKLSQGRPLPSDIAIQLMAYQHQGRAEESRRCLKQLKELLIETKMSWSDRAEIEVLLAQAERTDIRSK